MRPNRLSFTAIGSYPGTVEIDFDQFAAHGLFHIQGPTGAGKSSLLDAMCFALYGEVAKPRLTDRLRSDHALGAVEAVAELDFSAQDGDYRIIRKPSQMRPKKRGTGETRQWPSATLLRRMGDEWVPVSDNVDEVNAKVRDLTGLNSDQFMQVVVLPQGLFAEALRANASKREELLRTLFQTVRFGNYTEHLKSRADAARDRFEAARGNAQRDLDQLNALANGLGLIEGEHSVENAELIALAEAMLVREKELLISKRAAHQKLEADHQRVLREADLWQRRVGAQNRFNALEENADEMAEVQRELACAELANPLVALVDGRDAAQQSVSEASAGVASLQSAVATTDVDSVELTAAIKSATDADWSSESFDELNKALRKVSGETEVLVAEVERVETARQKLETVEARKQAAVSEVEAIASRLAESSEARQVLEDRAQALSETASNVQGLAERVNALRTQAAALQKLGPAERKLLAKQSQLNAVEQASIDAQRRQIELLERRLSSMAGELSQALVDGDPCAVCGSAEHPAPAPSLNAVLPEELQSAQEAVQSANAQVTVVKSEVTAVQADYESLRRAAGELLESADPDSVIALAQEALDSANAAALELKQVRAEQKQLNGLLEQVQSKRLELTSFVASLEAEAKSLRAIIDAFVSRHGSVDSEQVVAQRNLQHHLSQQLDELGRASERKNSCAKALAEATARLEAALPGAATDVSDSVRNQARSHEHMILLRDTVEQWRNAKAAATAVLNDPEVAAVESSPNIELDRQVFDASRAELDEQLSRVSRLEPPIASVIDLAQKTEAAQRVLKPLQDDVERLTTLWQLCNGTQSNAMRMSLERYVLAAYLEEVASAASLRLQTMSSGRYRLHHSDAKVKGNGASGLTLLVSDAYTGKQREVNTLSGGETFLASLALALGLADVVQQHAGGVHIEALFIDEGFGSLDPETLDLAMAELDRLRAGGRLVGIISHVETLRDRIPAGIEVVKGPEGSSVKIIGLDTAISAKRFRSDDGLAVIR